jgi:2-desacetyl-2-hydroxyethyl bacteriochlorophyllide A dehydrogenase
VISDQLWFTRPCTVEIRQNALRTLEPDEVLVRTLYSGISAGTEMLVYQGKIPSGMALDSGLETLKHNQTCFPLQYGYAAVGRVEQLGQRVDPSWSGKVVFAFQPHASHFITTPAQLNIVPEHIDPLAAVFLANTETAVSLVLDGNPQLGEKVVVLGQGIVGLLVSAILAQFPLSGLYALDRVAERRTRAVDLGAMLACDPDSESALATLHKVLSRVGTGSGADLVYELTGTPEAINLAIALCGYSGRILVGSWYGTRTAALQLGGSYHRNRIRICSSQVSTIAPELTGRWDKARRFETAWQIIEKLRPESLVSHRIPFDSAAKAYQLLEQSPEQALQIVFEYRSE